MIATEDRWGRSMGTMCPEKPEAVPLCYAARFGFGNLAEHLIAKHPGHVNASGGREITQIHVAVTEGHHGADVNNDQGGYIDTPL